MSGMGGGEELSSSPNSKQSPRRSSPEVSPLPWEQDLMEAALMDLRLEDEQLADSKAMPRPSSPELGRGEGPSSANLRAAGSAPYSRHFVARDIATTGGTSRRREGDYTYGRFALWHFAMGLAWLDRRWRMPSDAGLLDSVLSDSLMTTGYRRGTALTSGITTKEDSYHSSDEELDTTDAYFNYLVETFITAAYPPGMIWSVATGPGQEEDAVTPSASASRVEARAARHMTELQSAEADVTTRSGVAERPRMVPCERWTWKHQTTEDGGLIVMSPSEKQPRGDRCMPTATKLIMESNVRVQLKKDCLLSVDNLINIADASKRRFPLINVGVERYFKLIQAEGVISQDDYLQSAKHPVRYGIKEYIGYRVDDPDSMRHALYKLRSTGPLMGVLKISGNYNECAKSGKIYKYNPDLVKKDTGSKTHAVCIISFGIEDLPYLEAQSTHGKKFKDFLKIDVTSLLQLWRIVVT